MTDKVVHVRTKEVEMFGGDYSAELYLRVDFGTKRTGRNFSHFSLGILGVEASKYYISNWGDTHGSSCIVDAKEEDFGFSGYRGVPISAYQQWFELGEPRYALCIGGCWWNNVFDQGFAQNDVETVVMTLLHFAQQSTSRSGDTRTVLHEHELPEKPVTK